MVEITNNTDKNQFLCLNVSKDKMEARLSVLPFDDNSADITLKDVLQFLKNKNITYGIKEDVIKNILQICRERNKPAEDEIISAQEETPMPENTVIAKGVWPIDGEDAKITFLVSDKKTAKNKDDDDEQTDYRDVKEIKTVRKDQPLAKLTPATRGKPGRDIFNIPIDPTPGKECELPCGAETRISDMDKNCLIACIDGHADYDGVTISVSPSFNVKEDIDFSVGNVSYNGPVEIEGNVKSGFTINATGNIEIGGTVNDAVVKSNADVTIKGGFVGTGAGLVEAIGNVTIGFARNQMIAGTNVEFNREAVDCAIYAKEAIIAKGGRLSIVGGLLCAGNEIEVDVLGSKIEVPTEAEAGIDYVTSKGCMKIKKELNLTASKIARIDHEITILRELKKVNGSLPSKQQHSFDEFLNKKNELTKKNEELITKEQFFTRRLTINKDARIIVHHTAYAGVTIKIGGESITLQESCFKKTFFLNGKTIEMM